MLSMLTLVHTTGHRFAFLLFSLNRFLGVVCSSLRKEHCKIGSFSSSTRRGLLNDCRLAVAMELVYSYVSRNKYLHEWHEPHGFDPQLKTRLILTRFACQHASMMLLSLVAERWTHNCVIRPSVKSLAAP